MTGTDTIGSLVIDLRANVAQLRVDMDAVKSEVQKSSREMSSQMKQDMTETRQVLALMRDDFGVGVPRELRKVIASSELVRDSILGIKDALFGIAFFNLGLEAFTKIKDYIEKSSQAAEEEAKHTRDIATAAQDAVAATVKRAEQLALIGKGEEERAALQKKFFADELDRSKIRLSGLQAQIAAKVALMNLDVMAAGDAQGNAMTNTPIDSQEATDDARAEGLAAIAKLVAELKPQLEAAQKAIDDAIAGAKTNAVQLAGFEQGQLDAAIAKLGEFRNKVEQTVDDPLQRVTAEWEKIRAAQGLLLEQYQKGNTVLLAAGTLMAEWHAQQKVLNEEAAKLPGELQKGLTVLKEIQQLQGQPVIAGIVGSMPQAGKPQLNVDMKGAAIDRFASNFKDAAAQGKLLEKAMDDLLTPMDKFRIEQQEIELLKEKFKDYPEAVKALNLELLKANPEFQKLQAASAEFGKDLSNELDQLITGSESFGQALKNIAKDIEQIALKALLLQPLQDFFSGGKSGTGGITNFLGKLFSGLGFAGGGDPPVGQFSLVGENGPELFMPSTAGTIIPNGALGGTVNNFYIDAKGAAAGSEAAIIRGLQRALEQNRQQSVASAIDYQRRR